MQSIRLWTQGVPVEHDAMAQLRNIAALPILAGHVAVMPDVHLGKGATVGSVIPTRGAIIPAAVGVDVGCGMLAARTSLVAADLPESLSALRSAIETAIPVGFAAHGAPVRTFHDGHRGMQLHTRMKQLRERFDRLLILNRLGNVARAEARLWNQLGTLGGGNHFIEICLDEASRVWLMLHSGSRHIGKTIGECAIEMAKEQAHSLNRVPADRDLSWLDEGTPAFDAYVEALQWAQDYAATNRDLMLLLLCKVLSAQFGERFAIEAEVVNCHHNYASIEDHFGSRMWVTRKGAVSARLGELGIIPGSMGAKSFIVRGKGAADAYCSCSHGAGRSMSRGQAKRLFDLEAMAQQTAGVECRKDAGVIDEIPAAYKDIDAVMAAQSDLVSVEHTLKQVLCVKG